MAFEAQFAEIEDKSCHLLSCCCWGLSCTACDDPCCLDRHKFCCMSGGCTSGEECCGQKGCLTSFGKALCCVEACSLNNMAIGCCSVFILGRPYGEGRLVNDREAAFMEEVFWCYYCCCGGTGCAPTSPSQKLSRQARLKVLGRSVWRPKKPAAWVSESGPKVVLKVSAARGYVSMTPSVAASR
ncbi:unnamed protein product [Symbiodinium sp. CCMP2456]|nr:unnamed protein product [Symbiodinium sp. CCMP2456]